MNLKQHRKSFNKSWKFRSTHDRYFHLNSTKTTWGEGIILQTIHHATQYIQLPQCQMQEAAREEGLVQYGSQVLNVSHLINYNQHQIIWLWNGWWNETDYNQLFIKRRRMLLCDWVILQLVRWWRGSWGELMDLCSHFRERTKCSTVCRDI